MSEAARELMEIWSILTDRLGEDLQQADPAALEALRRELAGHSTLRIPGEGPGGQSRWQDQVILEAIPPGSSVLDLGCGHGQLLAKLQSRQRVRGQGVELDLEKVSSCIAAGVPVLQADIDQGLQDLADHSFDYVVLEETLQTLHHPVQVLREMLRVGRTGIVSFPNFGHWRVRLDLLINGRMPTTRRLPFGWYDTPNIHLFTINDFVGHCDEEGIAIVGGTVYADGELRPYREGDNLRAAEALFLIRGPMG